MGYQKSPANPSNNFRRNGGLGGSGGSGGFGGPKGYGGASGSGGLLFMFMLYKFIIKFVCGHFNLRFYVYVIRLHVLKVIRRK